MKGFVMLNFRARKMSRINTFVEENNVKAYIKEMRQTFPNFAAVFIDERDKYLAVKLRNIA